VTLSDLLGNARDAPLLLVLFGALLSVVVTAAGIIGRRLVASMARQGARIGTLERTLRSERLRRRQLEQCLREDGIPLPYWPDDPPELYAANARRGNAYQDQDSSNDLDRRNGRGNAYQDQDSSNDLDRRNGPDWTPADQLVTTFDPLPRVPVPVPPLSADERAAAARHRRS
jgi:hypothetical protein